MELKEKLKKCGFENITADEDGFYYISSCSVGDNFYDYDEDRKPLKFKKEFKWMENHPNIIIYECCDCCCCAGW